MIKITIPELLDTVLSDLKSMDGIQASALVTNEGLMMASDIENSNVDAETFGAVIAMLTRSATHTAKQLNKGEIEYLLLNTKKGRIVIIKISSNIILTALTNADLNISSTIEKLKGVSEKIKKIFIKV